MFARRRRNRRRPRPPSQNASNTRHGGTLPRGLVRPRSNGSIYEQILNLSLVQPPAADPRIAHSRPTIDQAIDEEWQNLHQDRPPPDQHNDDHIDGPGNNIDQDPPCPDPPPQQEMLPVEEPTQAESDFSSMTEEWPPQLPDAPAFGDADAGGGRGGGGGGN